MRRFRHPAVLLALLSPMIGELVSGSTPPLAFFHPVFAPLMIFFYGAGILLVREAALRLDVRWPGLLLLTGVFGVSAEAGVAGTWSNTGPDAGTDLLLGTWAGTNWGIIPIFCLYHAVFSLGIPLVLTNLAFPEQEHARWLSRRTTWALAVLWGGFSVAFIAARLDPVLTPTTIGVAVGFVLLALRSRRWTGLSATRVRTDLRPRTIALVSFGTTFGVFAIGWWTRPDFPLADPLIGLTVITILAGWWRISTTRNAGTESDSSLVPVIAGALGYLALQGSVVELLGGLGMSLVALTTWVGIWRLWRREVPRQLEARLSADPLGAP